MKWTERLTEAERDLMMLIGAPADNVPDMVRVDISKFRAATTSLIQKRLIEKRSNGSVYFTDLGEDVYDELRGGGDEWSG